MSQLKNVQEWIDEACRSMSYHEVLEWLTLEVRAAQDHADQLQRRYPNQDREIRSAIRRAAFLSITLDEWVTKGAPKVQPKPKDWTWFFGCWVFAFCLTTLYGLVTRKSREFVTIHLLLMTVFLWVAALIQNRLRK